MRRLYTAADAQRALGINANTIRSWAQRGKLWPAGLDSRWQPMYDREDLQQLAGRKELVA